MRAGRPRSQGNHSPLEGESQKPSRQAKADAVGGVWRATSQKADVLPLGNSRLPASRARAHGYMLAQLRRSMLAQLRRSIRKTCRGCFLG